MVKINIFRNSIDTANFIEQLTAQNGGGMSWKVLAGYTSGSYILRIKADPAETGCIGDRGVFEIKSKMTLTPTL